MTNIPLPMFATPAPTPHLRRGSRSPTIGEPLIAMARVCYPRFARSRAATRSPERPTMTAAWLLLPAVVALDLMKALHARRRVTHPFTGTVVDVARAQSRLLSRASRDGVGGPPGSSSSHYSTNVVSSMVGARGKVSWASRIVTC
jgi:hypothetical protein